MASSSVLPDEQPSPVSLHAAARVGWTVSLTDTPLHVGTAEVEILLAVPSATERDLPTARAQGDRSQVTLLGNKIISNKRK